MDEKIRTTIALQSRLSLLTVARGAAAELFDRELDRVLENVEDKNTPPDKAREIILKVKIEPTDDSRTDLSIEVSASSKIAAVYPVTSVASLGRVKGTLLAFEPSALQGGLFDPTANQRVDEIAARASDDKE